MIATVSPSSANCEHTINTLRYADRVKELKGPSNLGTGEALMPREVYSPANKSKIPVAAVSEKIKTTTLQEEFVFDNEMDDFDAFNDNLDSSPLKLTESDDSFLLSTFEKKTTKTSTTKSVVKLKESLHHSIAVLYDRVSNCNDADLLELLGDELEGLLAAFNK